MKPHRSAPSERSCCALALDLYFERPPSPTRPTALPSHPKAGASHSLCFFFHLSRQSSLRSLNLRKAQLPAASEHTRKLAVAKPDFEDDQKSRRRGVEMKVFESHACLEIAARPVTRRTLSSANTCRRTDLELSGGRFNQNVPILPNAPKYSRETKGARGLPAGARKGALPDLYSVADKEGRGHKGRVGGTRCPPPGTRARCPSPLQTLRRNKRRKPNGAGR